MGDACPPLPAVAVHRLGTRPYRQPESSSLMAIGKPRGTKGMRPVYVYDPARGRKVYVGSRQQLRGPGGAQQLERDKHAEFNDPARHETPELSATAAVAAYAERWLDLKHGPGTRRPSPTTYRENVSRLKPFLADFGARPLGSITRREALDWSLAHQNNARAISAMFNDALDDELVAANPFANRRQEQPKGRKNITPITEQELERLIEIAHQKWQGYGPVCGAWLTMLGWVGCRPGEAFKATWEDLDLEHGEITITRIKRPYSTTTVVLPRQVQDALMAMGTPRTGRLFSTVHGKALVKGSSRYYWDPVRTVFLAEIDPARRDAILGGRPDFDMYELRHLCASVMADRGLNEFDIAHQLGNTPETCRDTYIHAYTDRVNDRARLALEQPPKVVQLRRTKGGDAS
jgi:integrase